MEDYLAADALDGQVARHLVRAEARQHEDERAVQALEDRELLGGRHQRQVEHQRIVVARLHLEQVRERSELGERDDALEEDVRLEALGLFQLQLQLPVEVAR
eukprot:7325595-Prymnesium_polylepis.1